MVLADGDRAARKAQKPGKVRKAQKPVKRVSRPALSASRAVDIIDLLTGLPHRSFSLTEISRQTKINVASCHTVLAVLVERGYITRSVNARYSLGRVLVAAGSAALQATPLLVKAEETLRQLAQELDVPMLLTTAIGDEVVCLLSIADRSGRLPSFRAGKRSPLVAPFGTPFWPGHRSGRSTNGSSAGPPARTRRLPRTGAMPSR